MEEEVGGRPPEVEEGCTEVGRRWHRTQRVETRGVSSPGYTFSEPGLGPTSEDMETHCSGL